MKMTITITFGTLVKVVLALAVALTVIVILATDATTQDTQGRNVVPPTVNTRTDR